MGKQLSQLQIMGACLEFLSFTNRAERLMFGLLLDRNSIFAMTAQIEPAQSIQKQARKKGLEGIIWYSWLEIDGVMRYCVSLAVPPTIPVISIISLVLITVRWKLFRGKTDAIFLPVRLV
jgi:hypothetical protein